MCYAYAASTSYKTSGTKLAYGLTKCLTLDPTDPLRGVRYLDPKPGERMVLRSVRYQASVWCYAACGTERAYGATRRAVLSERTGLQILTAVQYMHQMSLVHQVSYRPTL
eukprot:2521953-Rhodomonas_salina.1